MLDKDVPKTVATVHSPTFLKIRQYDLGWPGLFSGSVQKRLRIKYDQNGSVMYLRFPTIHENRRGQNVLSLPPPSPPQLCNILREQMWSIIHYEISPPFTVVFQAVCHWTPFWECVHLPTYWCHIIHFAMSLVAHTKLGIRLVRDSSVLRLSITQGNQNI